MTIRNNLAFFLVVLLCYHIGPVPSHGQFQAGRNLEGRKTFTVSLSLGSVFGLDGEIQETERPIEVIGGQTSGAPPEDYSWKELGFDDGFGTWGLNVEKVWKYITLQGHLSYGNPTVSSTSDRDYYIGVGEVSFQGQEFEYMVIEEGEDFSGDIDLYMLDLRMLITPIYFGDPDYVGFTPWLHVGLYSFLADYTINAGPARGVTQYENPPRDYVTGGTGTGQTGLLVPELGIGGELSLSLSERLRLYLQAHAALLKVSGTNRDFGVSSRNEKAVDVDYATAGARVLAEWLVSDRVDWIGGVEFRYMSGDAEIRATDKSNEEILTLREKFDKDAHFEMSSLTAFIGLRF